MAEITVKQEKMIAALLAEPTIEAACAAAGISHTHLGRWRKEPAFIEAWRQARADAMGAAMSALQSASGKAVAYLVATLTNEDASHRERSAAARAILDYGFKSFELESVAQRIDALERMLQCTGND
jgi:hypothetical protein